MKAMDIGAEEIRVFLGGEDTPLRFDHTAMQHAELYFEAASGPGRGINYLGILIRATYKQYIALAAVAYGAMASAIRAKGARSLPQPEQFDRCVDFGQLLAISDELIDAATRSLPKGDEKNGKGQPTAGNSSESD